MKVYRFLIPACFIVFSIEFICSCSTDTPSTGQSAMPVVDRGTLRVDDNGRYFVFNDGTPYIPIGLNHFLWAPVALGAAGNLHSWVSPKTWPELSEKKLDWIKGFSDFCKTINWSQFNSRNVDTEIVTDQPDVKVFACRDSDEMLFYLMKDDTADTFVPTRTQLKISSQMDGGRYELRWIDIRTGEIIKKKRISGFPATVNTPDFKDGLFGHIRKVGT